MNRIIKLAIAGILASSTPCFSDWKDDVWVDTDRKSPHRPLVTKDVLAAHLDEIWTEIDKKAPRHPMTVMKGVLADWKDDVWVDTDRKSPHRPVTKSGIVIAALTADLSNISARRRDGDDRNDGALIGE